MKIVSPTAMASLASLAPTSVAYVQGEDHAVTTKPAFDASSASLIGSIPFVLHRRRPIANSKYKSPFKLDISKPNIDGTKAAKVYILICSKQPQPELDEKESVVYRVIIPTSAIELLNSEDSNTTYSFEHAYKNINYDIMEYIFLPMIDKEHWTVMCFNMIDQHIDVLDSAGAMRSKATKVEDEKMRQKVISRFLDVLDRIYPNHFTKIRNWHCYLAKVPQQSLENDCGFFALKNMQYWDRNKLLNKVNTEDGTCFQQQYLYHVLFHELNDNKLLP